MNAQQAAAEALLDQGVSVPFKEVRFPFTKKTWSPRVVMRRPRLGGQIRISRLYLRLGVTYEQMLAFTERQNAEFMVKHGKALSLMIALTVCRGYLSGAILAPLVALIIRWRVEGRFIRGAHLTYMSLLSAQSFVNIIRSAEILNPMKPTLSQKRTGS